MFADQPKSCRIRVNRPNQAAIPSPETAPKPPELGEALFHMMANASHPSREAASHLQNLFAPNNSLERTQPGREFMYDVAVLRRSARGR